MTNKKEYLLYQKGDHDYHYTIVETHELENKTAYIKIHTDLGFFEGKALFNPSDEYSSYLGYEIAEARAQIKFFKRKIYLLKEKFNEANHIQSKVKKFRTLKLMNRKEKKIYKIIMNEVEQIQEEISTYQSIIKEIQKEIDNKIDTRIAILERKKKIKD